MLIKNLLENEEQNNNQSLREIQNQTIQQSHKQVIIKRKSKKLKTQKLPMSSDQQTHQKQKYLRQNIDPDDYEDFADYFMHQAGTEDLDISKFTLDELKHIVDKFNLTKIQQEQEQKHQRSFAIYQTADLQQAYNVLSAVQNDVAQFQSRSKSPQPEVGTVQTNPIQVQSSLQFNQAPFQPGPVAEQQHKSSSPNNNNNNNKQLKSPQKPSYQSASDLLDSVLASSETSSPTKNSPQNSHSLESKYRSSSQISLFENGNIWATTANIHSQPRKSAEFDHFWQFTSTSNANNLKKQDFKTDNIFANQAFDFTKPVQSQPPKPNEAKKSPEPVPSFEELTKNLNMAKKPHSYGAGNVQAPSNMKKAESSTIPVKLSPQSLTLTTSDPSKRTSTPTTQPQKQIKLISQKPITEPSLSAISNQPPVSVIKLPTSSLLSAYKNSKIPYKGPTVHKTDFKDLVKCYEASIRTQLADPRLEVAIEKHEIVEKNFFVGDYVMYSMTVRPLNIVCKRNYEDFTKLKNTLQKFYPGMQLPWLEKNSWFQTSAENVKKQKTMLEFFINDLIKNPEIRNSRIFEDFLTLKDHKAIKRKFQQYNKMDEFKALEELCVTGGKVEVVVSEKQRVYHECLDKMLQQFDDLLGKKNKLVEQLGNQFVQIHDTLTTLAKLSTQLSQHVKKFNQSVAEDQIPTLQTTFSIVSKSYQEWASRISFESKVVTKRLAPFYKYQKDNLDTMRSLLNTENAFYKAYMKRSANETASDNYTSSNLKAHKNGVLQESRNLTVLKYQLGYLSNMVCKESVRFFELMSDSFKAKWVYKAEKYNQRLSKDMQFYASVAAMAK